MKTENRILIVDAEAAFATAVRDRLESDGYLVEIAQDGDEGVRRAVEGTFDAIVLDRTLPARDGLAVCRDLRARGVTIPVLLLTPRDKTLDNLVELEARVEAYIRRSDRTTGHATTYPIGEFILDLRSQELRRGEDVTPLSTQEFKLLTYLYEHAGEVVDREELLSVVWGYDTTTYTRTVDVHIAWLRRKLGDREHHTRIVTVRGSGYRYVAE